MLCVRAARPATKPDTRLKSQLPSSPGVRGAPRVVPVFGGESISTPPRAGRTRGSGLQFQDFLAVHKLSTAGRKLSPCRPRILHRKSTAEATRRRLVLA